MDLSVLPVKQVMRWDLAVRVLAAFLVPLLVGYLRTGGLSGLLPAVIALIVSISYLGPDLGIFRWSVFSAVGTAVAVLLGAWLSGNADWWLQLLYVFLLFTTLGAMILAGLTTQLAFLPIAILGLIATLLFGQPITVELVLQTVLGAGWSLLLIATVPRWSGWPRIPLPPGGLKPDTGLLRRFWTKPSWRDWSFPLLLGSLAVLVLLMADVLGQGDRPYWGVLALVTVLGPQRQKTLEDGGRTLAAALIGASVGILLLRLPIPLTAAMMTAIVIGALGSLMLLSHALWSKTMMTVLTVVLVTLLARDDPFAVGHERFIVTAIGATTAILAAGLAEFLAVRMEQRHPEPIDPPDHEEERADA